MKLSASITIEVTVTYRMIADLMVTAIEGGADSWCVKVENNTPRSDDAYKPWYDDETYYADENFSFTVIEEFDDGQTLKHDVGPKVLAEGLQAMAQNSPAHFADILNDNHDATTADVFLQYLALGEVIYG